MRGRRDGYRHAIDDLHELLARDPCPPRNPNLFTSGTLFGEPGIYPRGTPMEPAAGPPMPDDRVRDEVRRIAGPDAAADLDSYRFGSVPDLSIRAALVVLRATVAAAVCDGFPDETTASALVWGAPVSPGRIVGPGNGKASTRVVNDRYRNEHFALLAGSLAHDLLWTPETSGHAAEAFLHALVAIVHVQLIACAPDLALIGTELSRRQNSLAISLLNSRRPGSARITLMAPDGRGTIPGGAASMQTPDFWSIPFALERDTDAPPLLTGVLARLVEPSVPRPDPLRFDDALARWFDEHHDERWLPPVDRVRVLDALGLLPGAVSPASTGSAG